MELVVFDNTLVYSLTVAYTNVYIGVFLLFDNIYKNNITGILRIYVNNEFIC